MATGSINDTKRDFIVVVNNWRDTTYSLANANSNGDHTYLASSVATAIPAGYKLIDALSTECQIRR